MGLISRVILGLPNSCKGISELIAISCTPVCDNLYQVKKNLCVLFASKESTKSILLKHNDLKVNFCFS